MGSCISKNSEEKGKKFFVSNESMKDNRTYVGILDHRSNKWTEDSGFGSYSTIATRVRLPRSVSSAISPQLGKREKYELAVDSLRSSVSRDAQNPNTPSVQSDVAVSHNAGGDQQSLPVPDAGTPFESDENAPTEPSGSQERPVARPESRADSDAGHATDVRNSFEDPAPCDREVGEVDVALSESDEAAQFFLPQEEDEDKTPYPAETCDDDGLGCDYNSPVAANNIFSRSTLPKRVGRARVRRMSLDAYPFRSKTGVAVIVTTTKYDEAARVTDRNQSERQADRLSEVLKSFEFEVELLRNLTKDELLQKLHGIVRKYEAEFRNHSAFLCVLMGHGKCGQYMCSGGQLIEIKDITELFSEERTFELYGIPKIFVIQMCQATSDSSPCLASPGSNMCIQYSTAPGGYDHDHPVRGSIFINKLIQNLSERGSSSDLQGILRRTARDTKEALQKMRDLNPGGNWLCDQLPVKHDTLDKSVYLSVYEDDDGDEGD